MTRLIRWSWVGLGASLIAACGGGGGWNNEGLVAKDVAEEGKIFAAGGIQYAAYQDVTTQKLVVAKYSGGKWTSLPDTGLVIPDAFNFGFYVDGSTPYVAAMNTTNQLLTVLQFSNNAWATYGGGNGPAPSTFTPITLVVNSATAFVGYNNGTNLQVNSVSSTAWTSLGTPMGASTSLTLYNLGTLNGNVYALWGDSTGVTLSQLNGTTWTNVATTTTGFGFEDSRCAGFTPAVISANGTLYVAYNSVSNGAVMFKLSASNTLDSVGTLGTISGTDTIECVSAAVYQTTPYVAFDDESRDSDPQPKAATVKVFSGGNWSLYQGYPSPNDIEATELVVDASDGHLYLTYQDVVNGGMTVQVH
jgi:hypothetical protein